MAFIFIFPLHCKNKKSGFVSNFDKRNARSIRSRRCPTQTLTAIILHVCIADRDGTGLTIRTKIFIEQVQRKLSIGRTGNRRAIIVRDILNHSIAVGRSKCVHIIMTARRLLMLPILRQLDLIILVLIHECGQVASGNCRRRRDAPATDSKEQDHQRKETEVI